MDKKSDFVGDHGGRYTDMDGQTKQFTYIDHDPKPSISPLVISEEEKLSINENLKQYRKELIERLTSLPASTCPFDFHDFTKRGKSIEWNIEMISDEGVPLYILRSLTVMVENRNNV